MDQSHDDGPTVIEPLDFRETSRPSRRRRPLLHWIGLFACLVLLLCLGLAGWFVLTARPVELSFDPSPDRITLNGPRLRLRLDESYLLRSGNYRVHAFCQGYHPLTASFVVGVATDNKIHFVFKKLPGIINLQCVSAADHSPLEGVEIHVDGDDVGETPLDHLELEPGVHAVRLERQRYQTFETEIQVQGQGHRQAITLELQPDWAHLQIQTRPSKTDLWIDGQQVATTPCEVEVPSGSHLLEIKADRHEPWQQRVLLEAGQSLTITNIELAPAKGRLTVRTEPAGALVTVDGKYVGTSPVEVAVAPDRDHLVNVARSEYLAADRTVRVGPEQSAALAFNLTPQVGTVRLQVSPDDVILFVDGTRWGPVKPQITLSAQEHKLEFRKAGFAAVERTIRPRPELPVKVTIELEQSKSETPENARELTAANGYALVLIRPTTYTMGSSRSERGRRSNETLRTVQLQRPFYVGLREVTNVEFRAFKSDHKPGRFENVRLDLNDRPAVKLTWEDAVRFCNWLSAADQLPPAYVEQEGVMVALRPVTSGYRLPTEAEWEYGARANGAGPLLKYSWGSAFPPPAKSGNFADQSASEILNRKIDGYDDGYAGPAPVGSFVPNGFGLLDLGGNVAEWCHDFYAIYSYDKQKKYIDPVGPERGQHHVIRGSSWRHYSISALRLSYRDYGDQARDDLGFRIYRYPSNTETSNDH